MKRFFACVTLLMVMVGFAFAEYSIPKELQGNWYIVYSSEDEGRTIDKATEDDMAEPQLVFESRMVKMKSGAWFTFDYFNKSIKGETSYYYIGLTGVKEAIWMIHFIEKNKVMLYVIDTRTKEELSRSVFIIKQ